MATAVPPRQWHWQRLAIVGVVLPLLVRLAVLAFRTASPRSILRVGSRHETWRDPVAQADSLAHAS